MSRYCAAARGPVGGRRMAVARTRRQSAGRAYSAKARRRARVVAGGVEAVEDEAGGAAVGHVLERAVDHRVGQPADAVHQRQAAVAAGRTSASGRRARSATAPASRRRAPKSRCASGFVVADGHADRLRAPRRRVRGRRASSQASPLPSSASWPPCGQQRVEPVEHQVQALLLGQAADDARTAAHRAPAPGRALLQRGLAARLAGQAGARRSACGSSASVAGFQTASSTRVQDAGAARRARRAAGRRGRSPARASGSRAHRSG